jgi:spore germination protein KB
MNNDTEKQTISVGQLAILFVSFMIGSSIVYIPNPVIQFAGNMAWLSLIISTLMGILLLSLAVYLFRCYPDEPYPEFLNHVYGRWISAVVSIVLMLILYIMVSYIVLGIGNFFVNTMMVETPMYVFNGLTIITAAYTVHAGIEVMGRMFFLLVSAMLSFVILIDLLAAPIARVDTLLPLFADGMKPILHGVYFSFGFPFGELYLFSALYPFVRKESRPRVGKWMYVMTAVSGFFLLNVVLMTIMTLGPLAADRKFSLYSVARLIQVGQFISGIEAIVGIALIAGSFMKATIALFILNHVTTKFFKLKDDKILLPGIAFITFLMSVTMFQEESEFAYSVNDVWPMITWTVGIGPLILAAIITFMKRWISARKQARKS